VIQVAEEDDYPQTASVRKWRPQSCSRAVVVASGGAVQCTLVLRLLQHHRAPGSAGLALDLDRAPLARTTGLPPAPRVQVRTPPQAALPADHGPAGGQQLPLDTVTGGRLDGMDVLVARLGVVYRGHVGRPHPGAHPTQPPGDRHRIGVGEHPARQTACRGQRGRFCRGGAQHRLLPAVSERRQIGQLDMSVANRPYVYRRGGEPGQRCVPHVGDRTSHSLIC
jgi:hypothetical protein